MSASATANYRPETRLVHAGTLRSQFGETSEALFLTQGYVYDSAAQAEARFKGEDPGYQYSRFANPTVTMFEQRMAAFEGAEAARATATGMAAVTLALMGQVKAGDHVVAVEGAVRLVPLRGRGTACRASASTSTLVDGTDLDAVARRRCGRTPRPSSWKRRPIRRSKCSTSRRSPRSRTRPARRWWSTTCSRRRCGRARSSSAPTAWSIRPPSTSTARAAASAASSSARRSSSRTTSTTCIRQTGPSMSPFNAWVMLKGLETLAVRVRAADRDRGQGRGRAGRASEGHAADLSRPRRTIRRPTIVKKQMKGGSTLVAFEVEGGKEGAFRVPGRAQAGPHLQQSRRRQEPDHPSGDDDASALTPEQRAELGISDGLVRLSCGLEHPDDLIEDLLTALKAV